MKTIVNHFAQTPLNNTYNETIVCLLLSQRISPEKFVKNTITHKSSIKGAMKCEMDP
jgi:hypothetical protein